MTAPKTAREALEEAAKRIAPQYAGENPPASRKTWDAALKWAEQQVRALAASLPQEPEAGAVDPIQAEVSRAVVKFPTWPTDPLHALAVLGEEFGELTKAMLQLTYEPHKTSAAEVRTEALQTAAMALRLFRSLDRYEYKRCEQHEQLASALPARAQPASEYRPATLAECIYIIRARLSEQFSPAEKEELLEAVHFICAQDELKEEPEWMRAQPAALPEGWVAVPREPTREMKLAICEKLANYMGNEGFTSWNQRKIQRAYHAMLVAAPSPSNEESK